MEHFLRNELIAFSRLLFSWKNLIAEAWLGSKYALDTV